MARDFIELFRAGNTLKCMNCFISGTFPLLFFDCSGSQETEITKSKNMHTVLYTTSFFNTHSRDFGLYCADYDPEFFTILTDLAADKERTQAPNHMAQF